MAKEAGIKVDINTDAHSIAEMSFIVAGLNQAQGVVEAGKRVKHVFAAEVKEAASPFGVL
jgi:histidinol phosphatase-like PHP family hydrolase